MSNKTYRFRITRDMTESVFCTVEAGSIGDAIARAVDDPKRYADQNMVGRVDWTTDDNVKGSPYIADPDDYTIVDEPSPPWDFVNPHPEFTIEDWQYEVQNRDTILGYNEWVVHKHEDAINENCKADRQ